MEDPDSLPAPEVLIAEIQEEMAAILKQFGEIASASGWSRSRPTPWPSSRARAGGQPSHPAAEDAGVALGAPDADGDATGRRRALMWRYVSTLDLVRPTDAARLLQVLEQVLTDLDILMESTPKITLTRLGEEYSVRTKFPQLVEAAHNALELKVGSLGPDKA